MSRFQKGQSGNAGGRPKALRHLQAKCRELTPQLLERLEAIATMSKSETAALKAIEMIMDRGWGKPVPIDFAELSRPIVVKITETDALL
jgi:hypothetical protein